MWIANNFKTISKQVIPVTSASKKVIVMSSWPVFLPSSRKDKKYMVVTPKGKRVHFGDANSEQFKDSTGLRLYSHMDHGDTERRRRYLARAKGITNKKGELTWKDKESANYYSVRWLW
jgi:hypothetical protein